ncbi:MAG: hypothetical protein WAW06_08405, partial [bacterium]
RCLIDQPRQVAACGWRENEDGFFFFAFERAPGGPHVISLYFRDLAGRATELATSPDFAAVNLDVSPQGDAVVIDRLENLGSDIALVEDFR